MGDLLTRRKSSEAVVPLSVLGQPPPGPQQSWAGRHGPQLHLRWWQEGRAGCWGLMMPHLTDGDPALQVAVRHKELAAWSLFNARERGWLRSPVAGGGARRRQQLVPLLQLGGHCPVRRIDSQQLGVEPPAPPCPPACLLGPEPLSPSRSVWSWASSLLSMGLRLYLTPQ